MEKYLLTLLLGLSLQAGLCDKIKIYESDELLMKVNCKSLKYNGCVAKGFTVSGREYLTMAIENEGGTNMVQMYKWLDTPNTKYAQSWEASRVVKLKSRTLGKTRQLTEGTYNKVDNELLFRVVDETTRKTIINSLQNCH